MTIINRSIAIIMHSSDIIIEIVSIHVIVTIIITVIINFIINIIINSAINIIVDTMPHAIAIIITGFGHFLEVFPRAWSRTRGNTSYMTDLLRYSKVDLLSYLLRC